MIQNSAYKCSIPMYYHCSTQLLLSNLAPTAIGQRGVKGKSNDLEAVQRSFLKYLPGAFYLSYEERLQLFSRTSILAHLCTNDLVALYKLLTGKFRDLDPTEFVEFASGNTRGHPLKIAKPILKTHMRNFLPFRVMNVWNARRVADWSRGRLVPRSGTSIGPARFSVLAGPIDVPRMGRLVPRAGHVNWSRQNRKSRGTN